MTAIAGFRDGYGKVWIGADSCASDGDARGVYRTNKLVWLSVSGGGGAGRHIALGYTTSFRFGQILNHHLHLCTDIEDTPEAYLVRHAIPAIRKALSGNGWMRKENEREEGGAALIGYRGELFELQSDMSVLEPEDPIAACGSGYQYTLAAMWTARREMTRERGGREFVEAGLRAAAHFAPGVMEPFRVVAVTA